ncbi:type VII secretion integral membrane protein EccD [Arthrobacter sp.]|uniref:type VII secretion integral membrane protein EccD n=1 Tax=Arthrobacter sp. TaxID=1667 RepID=UPI003A9308D5
MAQPYTRVTLVGDRRNADLLLPASEAVGTLMPQILDLLGDAPGDGVSAKVLLTASGEPIASQDSLAQAQIHDGARLTLVSNSEAPPPAVVYDISDTVVEQTREVGGSWNRTHLVTASGIFAAMGLWLSLDLVLGRYLPDARWWILLAVGAGLLALGAAVSAGSRPVASALMGAGWGAGMIGLIHWPADAPLRLLLAAAGTAVFVACLATVLRYPRAVLLGSGVLAVLTGVWAGSVPLARWAAGVADADLVVGAGAIASICSILALGMLPSLALSLSGLAALDDRRANGSSIWRRDALAAIRSAHSGLTLATVAAAASTAVGLWLVASDDRSPKWTLPLLLALALATLLRSRAFPLAIERYALYAATAVGVVAGANALARLNPDTVWVVGLAIFVVAILTGLGLAVDLPDHVEARIRQICERLEMLAILATLPLLVGYFGVYTQMLATF